MSLNMILDEFEEKLSRMRDYPEKALIFDITRFAESNIAYASQLANIIVARIIDPQTNITYKLPIFYLLDSIMKHVGGSYPALFSRHLAEVFIRAYEELPEKDQAKLDFLLITWEERKLLSIELLARMRNHIINRNANKQFMHQQPSYIDKPALNTAGFMPPIAAPRFEDPMPVPMNEFGDIHHPVNVNFNNPSYQRGIGARELPHRNDFDMHMMNDGNRPLDYQDQNSQMMRASEAPNFLNDPRNRDDIPFIQSQMPPARNIRPIPNVIMERENFPTYDEIFAVEMSRVLNLFYDEMGVIDRVPLDEVAVAFPNMFEQIKFEAKVQADEIMKTGILPPPIPAPAIVSQSISFRDGARKDSRERSPAGYGGRRGGRGERDSKRGGKSFKPGDIPGKLGGGYGASDERGRYGRGEMDDHRAGHGDGGPSGRTPTKSGRSSDRDFSGNAADLQHFMVNAFMCETPILVNLNRANELLDKLVTHAQADRSSQTVKNSTEAIDLNNKERMDVDDSISGQSSSQGKEHLRLPVPEFKLAALTVAERLQTLLEKVHIPPPLPPMLLGPLPLEPSKEYLSLKASEAAVQANQNNIKAVEKLVEPKFRVDELGRNPQKVVLNLYSAMPHQYSEDGVRFKTLSELARHTDSFLARKELSRKKELAGEKIFRQWYCTLSQWITNFNALGKENKTISNQKTGKPNDGLELPGMETEDLNNEIFVVPADEFFTRCPVSKEVFETVWDDEEGEFMYRNAVKVLVTEAADPSLYAQGQNTNDPTVHYVIVHKLLVLDGWLQAGRADTLARAKLRYSQSQQESNIEKSNALSRASGDDEDEDDIFVMLELAGHD